MTNPLGGPSPRECKREAPATACPRERPLPGPAMRSSRPVRPLRGGPHLGDGRIQAGAGRRRPRNGSRLRSTTATSLCSIRAARRHGTIASARGRWRRRCSTCPLACLSIPSSRRGTSAASAP